MVFSEENVLESCGPITYNDSISNEELLSVVGVEQADIFVYHVGGRPNDRRKK